MDDNLVKGSNEVIGSCNVDGINGNIMEKNMCSSDIILDDTNNKSLCDSNKLKKDNEKGIDENIKETSTCTYTVDENIMKSNEEKNDEDDDGSNNVDVVDENIGTVSKENMNNTSNNDNNNMQYDNNNIQYNNNNNNNNNSNNIQYDNKNNNNNNNIINNNNNDSVSYNINNDIFNSNSNQMVPFVNNANNEEQNKMREHIGSQEPVILIDKIERCLVVEWYENNIRREQRISYKKYGNDKAKLRAKELIEKLKSGITFEQLYPDKGPPIVRVFENVGVYNVSLIRDRIEREWRVEWLENGVPMKARWSCKKVGNDEAQKRADTFAQSMIKGIFNPILLHKATGTRFSRSDKSVVKINVYMNKNIKCITNGLDDDNNTDNNNGVKTFSIKGEVPSSPLNHKVTRSYRRRKKKNDINNVMELQDGNVRNMTYLINNNNNNNNNNSSYLNHSNNMNPNMCNMNLMEYQMNEMYQGNNMSNMMMLDNNMKNMIQHNNMNNDLLFNTDVYNDKKRTRSTRMTRKRNLCKTEKSMISKNGNKYMINNDIDINDKNVQMNKNDVLVNTYIVKSELCNNYPNENNNNNINNNNNNNNNNNSNNNNNNNNGMMMMMMNNNNNNNKKKVKTQLNNNIKNSYYIPSEQYEMFCSANNIASGNRNKRANKNAYKITKNNKNNDFVNYNNISNTIQDNVTGDTQNYQYMLNDNMNGEYLNPNEYPMRNAEDGVDNYYQNKNYYYLYNNNNGMLVKTYVVDQEGNQNYVKNNNFVKMENSDYLYGGASTNGCQPVGDKTINNNYDPSLNKYKQNMLEYNNNYNLNVDKKGMNYTAFTSSLDGKKKKRKNSRSSKNRNMLEDEYDNYTINYNVTCAKEKRGKNKKDTCENINDNIYDNRNNNETLVGGRRRRKSVIATRRKKNGRGKYKNNDNEDINDIDDNVKNIGNEQDKENYEERIEPGYIKEEYIPHENEEGEVKDLEENKGRKRRRIKSSKFYDNDEYIYSIDKTYNKKKSSQYDDNNNINNNGNNIIQNEYNGYMMNNNNYMIMNNMNTNNMLNNDGHYLNNNIYCKNEMQNLSFNNLSTENMNMMNIPNMVNMNNLTNINSAYNIKSVENYNVDKMNNPSFINNCIEFVENPRGYRVPYEYQSQRFYEYFEVPLNSRKEFEMQQKYFANLFSLHILAVGWNVNKGDGMENNNIPQLTDQNMIPNSNSNYNNNNNSSGNNNNNNNNNSNPYQLVPYNEKDNIMNNKELVSSKEQMNGQYIPYNYKPIYHMEPFSSDMNNNINSNCNYYVDLENMNNAKIDGKEYTYNDVQTMNNYGGINKKENLENVANYESMMNYENISNYNNADDVINQRNNVANITDHNNNLNNISPMNDVHNVIDKNNMNHIPYYNDMNNNITNYSNINGIQNLNNMNPIMIDQNNNSDSVEKFYDAIDGCNMVDTNYMVDTNNMVNRIHFNDVTNNVGNINNNMTNLSNPYNNLNGMNDLNRTGEMNNNMVHLNNKNEMSGLANMNDNININNVSVIKENSNSNSSKDINNMNMEKLYVSNMTYSTNDLIHMNNNNNNNNNNIINNNSVNVVGIENSVNNTVYDNMNNYIPMNTINVNYMNGTNNLNVEYKNVRGYDEALSNRPDMMSYNMSGLDHFNDNRYMNDMDPNVKTNILNNHNNIGSANISNNIYNNQTDLINNYYNNNSNKYANINSSDMYKEQYYNAHMNHLINDNKEISNNFDDSKNNVKGITNGDNKDLLNVHNNVNININNTCNNSDTSNMLQENNIVTNKKDLQVINKNMVLTYTCNKDDMVNNLNGVNDLSNDQNDGSLNDNRKNEALYINTNHKDNNMNTNKVNGDNEIESTTHVGENKNKMNENIIHSNNIYKNCNGSYDNVNVTYENSDHLYFMETEKYSSDNVVNRNAHNQFKDSYYNLLSHEDVNNNINNENNSNNNNNNEDMTCNQYIKKSNNTSNKIIKEMNNYDFYSNKKMIDKLRSTSNSSTINTEYLPSNLLNSISINNVSQSNQINEHVDK
ncbi:transcription factor with AP2 domain(s) [Plasmodium gaboni]|uniref:Transcription factor with AP2 domain(S) n=1 Tax=Plasmodium gaboni TaxID=647221 RepID=A0A151LRB9_9APIC|nr:transcription factor with AP2 domain(s) [Plasmodium gaboni]KYO01734.1 transcription factor with AP2 domain(s) [Plasmodium gaboni]